MQIPSASEYQAALMQICAQISPLQWNLLEAHYLAPNHTASSEEIALAAGKPWPVTNLHYGRLGTKLRRALDYRSFNIYTMIVSSILYFQRNTTGAALISSKYW